MPSSGRTAPTRPGGRTADRPRPFQGESGAETTHRQPAGAAVRWLERERRGAASGDQRQASGRHPPARVYSTRQATRAPSVRADPGRGFEGGRGAIGTMRGDDARPRRSGRRGARPGRSGHGCRYGWRGVRPSARIGLQLWPCCGGVARDRLAHQEQRGARRRHRRRAGSGALEVLARCAGALLVRQVHT